MAPIHRCLRDCLIALAAVSALAGAPVKLTLEQASSRREPSFAPAYEGQQIAVEGVVAARPIRLRDYSHLVIQDSTGHGLTLESADELFAAVEPGDHVGAEGLLVSRAGLPVL